MSSLILLLGFGKLTVNFDLVIIQFLMLSQTVDALRLKMFSIKRRNAAFTGSPSGGFGLDAQNFQGCQIHFCRCCNFVAAHKRVRRADGLE
jgi:hypothetical protein